MKRAVSIFATITLALGTWTAFATPASAAAPAALDLQSSSCPAIVQIGQTSGCVTELQNLLKQQGYDPGTVDGIFGGGTETAVKNFQGALGLKKDGLVGTDTKKALYTRQVTVTSSNCPTLQSGSRGGCVAYVQARLNSISGTSLTVDGKFGSATSTAVTNFQKARCINPDGIVGTTTKSYLVNNTKCAASLTLSASSWSATTEASSISVTVTANVSWTASSNATSWLTVTPTSGTNNGTLSVKTTANTSTSTRSGTITVQGGGITKTMSVTQAATAPSLSITSATVSPTSITLGQSVTLKVTTSASASSVYYLYNGDSTQYQMAGSGTSWSQTSTPGVAGSRTITFYAKSSNGTVSAGKAVSLTVTAPSTSETQACAPSTIDLGIWSNLYVSGKQFTARLCALPNVPSSGSESKPGSAYYITGANGKAIVRARYSQNFYDMTKAAQAAGITVAANSSFRTMQHQTALCNDNTACRNGTSYSAVAKPGTSNHQGGVAIDFTMTGTGSTSNCRFVSGVCQPPSNADSNTKALYTWLTNNSKKYGISQYVNEYWHWDVR